MHIFIYTCTYFLSYILYFFIYVCLFDIFKFNLYTHTYINIYIYYFEIFLLIQVQIIKEKEEYDQQLLLFNLNNECVSRENTHSRPETVVMVTDLDNHSLFLNYNPVSSPLSPACNCNLITYICIFLNIRIRLFCFVSFLLE